MYLAPKGYSVVIDGWGIETREDTYCCAHCCKVCFVPARHDPSQYKCRRCYKPVCQSCYGHDCDPYEAKMDRAEATDAWLRERLMDKWERAQTRSEAAAIEISLAKQQLWRDLGFG